MSLSDKNFLGTASDDDRMDYRTALKIMDRVVSDYLQRREPQDDLLPDEAEVTEAYNKIRNG
jgi:hypothetical protein